MGEDGPGHFASSTCLVPVLALISAEDFWMVQTQTGEVIDLCIFPLFNMCY